MAEYIEKEAFTKWIDEAYCKPCEEAKRDYNHCRCGACQYDDMMRDVESFEPADVAPVRHGRWVKTIGENGVTSACRCNLCGFEDNRYSLFNYCPNCGAKMDGGE